MGGTETGREEEEEEREKGETERGRERDRQRGRRRERQAEREGGGETEREREGEVPADAPAPAMPATHWSTIRMNILHRTPSCPSRAWAGRADAPTPPGGCLQDKANRGCWSPRHEGPGSCSWVVAAPLRPPPGASQGTSGVLWGHVRLSPLGEPLAPNRVGGDQGCAEQPAARRRPPQGLSHGVLTAPGTAGPAHADGPREGG